MIFREIAYFSLNSNIWYVETYYNWLMWFFTCARREGNLMIIRIKKRKKLSNSIPKCWYYHHLRDTRNYIFCTFPITLINAPCRGKSKIRVYHFFYPKLDGASPENIIRFYNGWHTWNGLKHLCGPQISHSTASVKCVQGTQIWCSVSLGASFT